MLFQIGLGSFKKQTMLSAQLTQKQMDDFSILEYETMKQTLEHSCRQISDLVSENVDLKRQVQELQTKLDAKNQILEDELCRLSLYERDTGKEIENLRHEVDRYKEVLSKFSDPFKLIKERWNKDSNWCELCRGFVLSKHHCRVCGVSCCSKCCDMDLISVLDYRRDEVSGFKVLVCNQCRIDLE